MTLGNGKGGQGTEGRNGIVASVSSEPILDASNDLERSSTTSSGTSIIPHDPYQFRDKLVSEETLSGLRNRKQGKHVAKFHSRQNELIHSLLKPMEQHTEDAQVEEESSRLAVKIAVYGSLYSNLFLCVLQLYAAISSGSLSLVATAIDSVFDIGSNVLLWWLHRKARRLDFSKWPVGGARLETIGNVIYGYRGACSNSENSMATVNLVVIIESIRTLILKEGDDLREFHLPSIIAVSVALAVKLALFVFSFSIRKQSSQVQVLWEDHRNDLFVNTFGGFPRLPVPGKVSAHLRPGFKIGLGIIFSWLRTIWFQFELLAGKSAPHEFIQYLIYQAATFSDDIKQIDTVRAYHSGPSYFVEIDIVMDAETPLWKAHDLSQQLQDKIETLPDVERAFVHVDHETSHTPEHRKIMKQPI
ncbi:cation diffusion facilitator 1 [Coprinopsis cinerea okayama7|uniref:Cation diffusion facilitator 1 n=1 Tax=Coprinopsis cinerea (strain Okayama-7 / 130 / ATCC MYA-4618 / FGSC 9003) TaxID=240176 RepID=A8N399_COPC7|nr:cation diffusion facilitator 1 [Coprinopsis cinerea okayama7\|eukprot:XP_001829344.2 cation diffusion facilitator 1 [Coprinopsis cinerea okayama7\